MPVFAKLMQARVNLLALPVKKSGRNTYAEYDYMTMEDFLPATQEIFAKLGLCGIVNFTAEIASLRIIDTEDNSETTITSPMGSAKIKGCHEVQNIGAVETYQRRYLWMAAMEIVSHDALETATRKDQVKGDVKNSPDDGPGVIKPSDGALDRCSPEERKAIDFIERCMRSELEKPDVGAAVALFEGQTEFSADAQVALWDRFSSSERRKMKEFSKARRAKAGSRETETA